MREIVPIENDTELLKDLVIFDLETTGLSPVDDSIIQIAAVRVVNGRIDPGDRFFTYVDPGQAIDSFITDLTGITDEDVRGAPGAHQAVSQFSEFCGSSLLVAHNGHAFDIPFLQRASMRRRRSRRPVQYIDSMHLSWQIWGRAHGVSHSLDRVVARLRVRTGGIPRHDARGDVQLLAGCVKELLGRMMKANHGYTLNVYKCHLPTAT